jgi:hypothetical protein
MIAVYSLAISCVVLQIDPAVRAQRKRVGARGAFLAKQTLQNRDL